MAYRVAKNIITSGNYVYAEMLDKLDVLLLGGRITQEQYTELTGMMTNPDA